MKKRRLQIGFRKTALTLSLFFTALGASAQTTNVFDDVISMSPAHTSLKLALETALLDDDLQDPMMNYTVYTNSKKYESSQPFIDTCILIKKIQDIVYNFETYLH